MNNTESNKGPISGPNVSNEGTVREAIAELILPPEGTITLATCQRLTDLSRSTILRRIKQNLFPKPFKYGSILLFPCNEIRRFLQNPSSFACNGAGGGASDAAGTN